MALRQHLLENPLLDEVKATTSKEAFLNDIGLTDYKLTIGILPGSRKKEIERILPAMGRAAHILKDKFPQLQFVLVKAPSLSEEFLTNHLPKGITDLRIVSGDTYDAINACDLCMVTSGTATLETGLLQKPMVVVYKTSSLSYMIAKMLVKIKFISLINIIFNKEIVPELVQHEATPQKISQELINIFTNEIRLTEVKDNLKKIPIYLGEGQASQKAAQEVINVL